MLGDPPPLEQATLGGGCFWCLEAAYLQLRGIQRVVSGYAGGHLRHPSYKQVTSGRSGHAEVVQISFDPAIISFRDLLYLFFTIHDPTTRNRQGNDIGPQYRSIILYHNDEQKAIAESVIAELQGEGLWSRPVVTELVPLERFYAAEDYHQNYYAKNPYQGYCQFVVAPKVAKTRQKFSHLLKTAP
ncbi:MAG: peptide-methionine (S)-S-oxide reductase MsrA [Anaerolineales bacterium]|nr:peptide-methionine (S)-S-oxide reductase MsrA [Anaerolineales bacterium]MCB9172440.1 peptide-methionine (S)-S-oxide reductase MsrA [Ardenticatenales bacterium]